MAGFGSATIRESVIAGTWYPGSAPALRQSVEGYLARVNPAQASGKVVALVSPHAGYAYSGQTAAHAFAQVRGAAYARVVLIGPLHRPIRGSGLGAWMTPAEDAYRTPLGEVRLDRGFIAELGQRVSLTVVRGDQEHSLEIELPFLQVALSGSSPEGGFQLVPIMAGEYIGDPGTPYVIQAGTTLGIGSWSDLPGSYNANGALQNQTITNTLVDFPAKRFFRLKSE